MGADNREKCWAAREAKGKSRGREGPPGTHLPPSTSPLGDGSLCPWPSLVPHRSANPLTHVCGSRTQ